jgi:kynurenine 3-monooxygenase
MPNVKIFFDHKLAGADFRRNLAWFEHRHQDAPPNPRYPSRPTGKPGVTEIEVPFDFMIGADGAHSAARYHLMKFSRMTYQQEYIETVWCEFHIPARDTEEGPEFALSPNHLHIWPGGDDDMFIAIPNTDRSFTATLFLPGARFEQLDRAHDAVLPSTFRTHFPGVVPQLISEADAVRQFRTNRHLPLISIKCHPYHHGGSVVILGDAAHAMVPFYGQGMNAGMEDVLQLYGCLDRLLPPADPASPAADLPPPPADPREAGPADLLPSLTSSPGPSPAQRDSRRAWALTMYTRERHPDAVAICDLALANYEEMSSHVTSPAYLVRKWAEERLHAYLPRWLGWGATQYARVSFGTERYSVVRDEARRQQGRLRAAGAVAGAGLVCAGVVGAVRLWRR